MDKKDNRSCAGCENRRRMISEAYKKQGVKGVAKTIPDVIRSFVKGEPDIRTRSSRDKVNKR